MAKGAANLEENIGSGDLDLNSAMDMLSNMLSTEKGQAQLENIISAFTGSDNPAPPSAPNGNDNLNNPLNNLETATKLARIMSAVGDGAETDGQRLIAALKPYLSEKRRAKADSAIRLLSFSKVWTVIKSLGPDFKL